MKKRLVRGFGLLAADDELIFLDRDGQLVGREARDGQRDRQKLLAGLLDIVGRITVRRRLGWPCATL